MSKFTAEDNKKVIAEYFAEYWGKGNVDIVRLISWDLLLTSGRQALRFQLTDLLPHARPRVSGFARNEQVVPVANSALKGREASKKMLTDFRNSFPDLTFWGVGPLIAENTPEGDFVVGRWDGGGTHTGPAFADLALGELPTANSGKTIRCTGTTVFRMEGGKIVEEIGEEGALRACSQLGLVGKLRWT